MPRRLFLTGITGFAGSHLTEAALARGDEVHGLAFEPPPYPFLSQVSRRVTVHRGDVSDVDAVSRALGAARPDAVIHLAGQAVPARAEADPRATVQVNVVGTAAVTRALAGHSTAALVVISSAEVYGAADRLPATEETPLRPPNVYAATKVAAEAVARDAAGGRPGPVVILRPVNQLGPRLHPELAASAFAKQIAEAEVGRGEPVIRHGRLDAQRDFLDVRDAARAYLAASDLREGGTFNVGTGRLVPIERILRILVDLARVSVRTETDPALLRAGDPSAFAVDASRFRKATGWSPRIDLERSLADLLDDWRERVGAELARA